MKIWSFCSKWDYISYLSIVYCCRIHMSAFQGRTGSLYIIWLSNLYLYFCSLPVKDSSILSCVFTFYICRNRLPMISDDLSHWSDIFTWRQHHYQFIVNHYDTHAAQDQVTSAIKVISHIPSSMSCHLIKTIIKQFHEYSYLAFS